MIMAIGSHVHPLIADLITEARDRETKPRQKANTTTAGVGAGITALLAGGTYWIESGVGGPEWFPLVVGLVGLLATVLGVSRTKNGVTDSVADRLNDLLMEWVDEGHDHPGEDTPDAPGVDAGEQARREAVDLRAIADGLTR